MKKIVILFVIILIGAGATAGALTSASLGWTLKSTDETAFLSSDEEGYSFGNITLELEDGPFVWIGTDETIIDFENISIEIPKPITDCIRLYTDKRTYIHGESVLITIENNGDKNAHYCGSHNHWIIEQWDDGDWKRLFPPAEFLIVLDDYISPGEREKGTWNGTDNSGDYRVAVSYFIEDFRYEFTDYAYFSISNYIGSLNNNIYDNDTLKLPEYIVWKDQDDVFIPLPPIQNIPIGDLPAIPIDKIPLGKYYNATDSITIYNVIDSIKIYNPYDGYWWIPIYPYFIND